MDEKSKRIVITSAENPVVLKIFRKNVTSFELETSVIFNSAYFFTDRDFLQINFKNEDGEIVSSCSSQFLNGNFPLGDAVDILNTDLNTQNCPFIFELNTTTLQVILQLQIQTINVNGNVQLNIAGMTHYDLLFSSKKLARKFGFEKNVFENLDLPVQDDEVVESMLLRSTVIPNVNSSSHLKIITNNSRFDHDGGIVEVLPLTFEKNFYKKKDRERRTFDETTVDYLKITLLDDDDEIYETNGLAFSLVFEYYFSIRSSFKNVRRLSRESLRKEIESTS